MHRSVACRGQIAPRTRKGRPTDQNSNVSSANIRAAFSISIHRFEGHVAPTISVVGSSSVYNAKEIRIHAPNQIAHLKCTTRGFFPAPPRPRRPVPSPPPTAKRVRLPSHANSARAVPNFPMQSHLSRALNGACETSSPPYAVPGRLEVWDT